MPTNNNSNLFADATTECYRIASTFLDARISRLLAGAETVFVAFADKAESDKLQTQFMDAINLVKHSSLKILDSFDSAFKKGFDDLGITREHGWADTESSWDNLEEWSLLDNRELSENVVAMNITEEAENTHFSELYSLHQRFSLATGGRVLEYERMPVGPHRLVSSFRHAVGSIELDQRIRLILYTLFRDFVLRDLNEIYAPMNQTLREAGILPNLKRIVSKQQAPSGTPKKPGVPHIPDAHETEADSSPTAGHRSVDSQRQGLPSAEESISSEGLFESIVELMSLKNPGRWGAPSYYSRSIPRAKEVAGSTGAGPASVSSGMHAETGPTVSSPTVVEAIDRIVQDGVSSMVSQPISDQESAIALANDPSFVERTIDTLSREREQIISTVSPNQMQPLDVQIIDIVGMLFEHMLNDERLPNIAKAALSRLQTPYLKAALIDKQLLHNTNHPARKLLNLLVESGENFVNEQSPGWGMFPALRKTVDEITGNFKDDIQIFVRAYDELKPKVEAQIRKISTLESRSKQIAQGRERFEIYKQKAAERIEKLISKHYVLPEVKSFLKNAWADRLVFILLRNPEGEDGEEWNRALGIATFLANLSVAPADSTPVSIQVTDYEEIRKEIGNDLARLGGKQPQEWRPVEALLCNSELLLQRLSSPRKKPGDLPRTRPTKDHARSAIPGGEGAPTAVEMRASAHEEKMIQTLRSLEFGTWFEFSPDPGSKPQWHKLSWHSSLTGKCMFVDRNGIKSKDVDILWLAREVLAQRVKIIEVAREPFFETALKSILHILKGY